MAPIALLNPGRYILQEDIVFHPNPEDGFAPTLKQNKEYPQAPRTLQSRIFRSYHY